MNTEKKGIIVIGSRGSKLALIQTEFVKEKLENELSKRGQTFKLEIKVIKSKGDKILDVALSKIGDKGLFTKELEVALQANEIDFAVHSLKDIPTHLPEGLVLGCITERHDVRDCLVIHPKHKNLNGLADLPIGSVIGSSSLRRIAQLKRSFPHLQFLDIRGNLNTRLQKLDEGDKYDGIILAVAGLTRLGMADRIHQILSLEISLHAVGQGALGIECRLDDEELLEMLSIIHHESTAIRCAAERAFLRELEGGCQVPVGVATTIHDNKVTLLGIVLNLDGSRSVKGELTGEWKDAEAIGKQLAQQCKDQGAESILNEVYEANK